MTAFALPANGWKTYITRVTRGGRGFLALSMSDRRLLLRTACALIGVRVALRIVPFRTLQSWLRRVPVATHTRAAPSAERLAWAVSVAARCAPDATCLTQAVVLQSLLARNHHPGFVRIGVARGADGHVRAHAWVMDNEAILIGGADADERYQPITAFDEVMR